MDRKSNFIYPILLASLAMGVLQYSYGRFQSLGMLVAMCLLAGNIWHQMKYRLVISSRQFLLFSIALILCYPYPSVIGLIIVSWFCIRTFNRDSESYQKDNQRLTDDIAQRQSVCDDIQKQNNEAQNKINRVEKQLFQQQRDYTLITRLMKTGSKNALFSETAKIFQNFLEKEFRIKMPTIAFYDSETERTILHKQGEGDISLPESDFDNIRYIIEKHSRLQSVIKDSSNTGYYFPVYCDEDTIGLLAFELQHIEPDLLDRLKLFTQVFGLNLQRLTLFEKVNRMAHFDSLTNLMVRWYFFERMENEINRAKGTRAPLSLIVLDIDHFKKFNDSYGHEVGDDVLRHISNIVIETFRSTDPVGRYGGEEIAILLPDTPLLETIKIAERLRVSIASTPCPNETHNNLKVTVSIGCSQYPVERTDFSAEDFFQASDRALYAAKNGGRNRVCSTEIHHLQGEVEK